MKVEKIFDNGKRTIHNMYIGTENRFLYTVIRDRGEDKLVEHMVRIYADGTVEEQ